MSLDSSTSYEWRVRALSDQASGPWSETFLLETNVASDDALAVTFDAPNELYADELLADQLYTNEFYDPLLNDNYNPEFNPGFNPEFNDAPEPPTAVETHVFDGVPMFSWQHEENAVGYEIEIVETDTRRRAGMFQYAESSLCIEGSCEIVLDNSRAEALDLPPILLISDTVVEGEAPYQATLQSPLVDIANLSNYSHEWSIEGRFQEFPDAPEFRHEFSEIGAHTVNILVASNDGRSEYASATVNISEPTMTVAESLPDASEETDAQGQVSGEATEAPSASLALSGETTTNNDTNIPDVLAALPQTPIKAPVVTVSEQTPALTIAASTTAESEPDSESETVAASIESEPATEEESDNLTGQESKIEQTVQGTTPTDETVQEPTTVAGWNNDMPHGGRAIGVVTSGITTGNAALVGHKSSRRFLAERSGEVKGFGYQNRVLTSGDIKDRAVSRRTSQPIWYEVQQAVGNDPKRGGYMLNNSYSVGNGGLQEVTLQTDDGSPDHLPSGIVIAQAKPYVPFDYPTKKWLTMDFISPGIVEAGQMYHLVYENLTPPPKLRGLSASEARNAPIDKGAIALDGVTHGIAIDPSERHGPFLRNFPAVLIKKSASSDWQLTTITSWYNLVYSDSVQVGETYAHLQGASAYRYKIEGSKQLRQQFVWNYPNISVDRIATRFGLDEDANGSSMSVVIKDQSFSTLATTSVPFDPELKEVAKSDNTFVGRQTRHSVGSLSNTVELLTGQTYYVEYSAASGAGYIMTPAIATQTTNGNTDRNLWTDGYAKQSTNGGNSWDSLNTFLDADIPMYLIPVGIPTQTPLP